MKEVFHGLSIDLRTLENEHHDNCSSCNSDFKNGDIAHLGYDKDNQPLYVCHVCADLIKTKSVKKVFMKRPYQVPDADCFLWRYMDFTKYVLFLIRKALYFSRVDQFKDSFEGAKGTARTKQLWDDFYMDSLKSALLSQPDTIGNLSLEEESEAQQLLRDMEMLRQSDRKNVFINCWQENEAESEAMWKLFAKEINNAVAIRTTYRRFFTSLSDYPDVQIGRIHYIDLNKDFIRPEEAYWCKRKSFEFEREVRAILHDSNCSSAGRWVDCNIEELVESVYISPTSREWFHSLVQDVTGKYGFSFDIKKSDLLEVPFY